MTILYFIFPLFLSITVFCLALSPIVAAALLLAGLFGSDKGTPERKKYLFLAFWTVFGPMGLLLILMISWGLLQFLVSGFCLSR